jgi:hypothetical protein
LIKKRLDKFNIHPYNRVIAAKVIALLLKGTLETRLKPHRSEKTLNVTSKQRERYSRVFSSPIREPL